MEKSFTVIELRTGNSVAIDFDLVSKIYQMRGSFVRIHYTHTDEVDELNVSFDDLMKSISVGRQ